MRKALSKWVLAEHIKPIGLQTVTKDGKGRLHIPDTIKPTIAQGRVLSVGDDVKGIRAGDLIFVPPGAVFAMDRDADDFVVAWTDVFAVDPAPTVADVVPENNGANVVPLPLVLAAEVAPPPTA